MRPLQRRWAIAWAFAVSVSLGGCEEPPGPVETPPPSERYARKFLPLEPAWVRESDIPERPQTSPAMVIWEVSETDPNREPTSQERDAAEALVARCYEVAERRGWFRFERGLADGYRLMQGDRRHYVNEAYLFDDSVLDCERPEFLMYYGTPEGKLLAGLMFYAPGQLERGPQIGGPLTIWHYHVWFRSKCLRGGLLLAGDGRNGCRDGDPHHRSPEMLHVWFLDHPDGQFATTMWLDRESLDAAIAARSRRGND